MHPHVLVFGGNGFVGSPVVAALLRRGALVTCVSRSGAAPAGGIPGSTHFRATKALTDVRYVRGDLLDAESSWAQGALEPGQFYGAVSCVGAFGTDLEMERLCGDTTVNAARLCARLGARRFSFVSAAGVDNPGVMGLPLAGYFRGKAKAEAAVLGGAFGRGGGTVLRAPFVHGDRTLGGVRLPLSLLGAPMEAVLGSSPFRALSRMVPALSTPLAVPIAVGDLAECATECVLGDRFSGVLERDSLAAAAAAGRAQ